MYTILLSLLVPMASAQDASSIDESVQDTVEDMEKAVEEAEAAADEAKAAADEAVEATEEAAEAVEEATEAAEDAADAVEEAAEATEEAAAEDDKKAQHSLTVGLGALYAAGNSEFLTANGEVKYGLKAGKNGFGAIVGTNINYARTDVDGDGTIADGADDSDGDGNPDENPFAFTSQRVYGSLRYDRFFDDSNSFYVKVAGEHDKPAGLWWRFSEGVGYGRQFVDTETTKVKFETGLDIVQEDRVDATDDTGAPINTASPDDIFGALRIFLGVSHAFNENVTLANDLEILEGLVNFTDTSRAQYEDLRINNTLALNVKLSSIFSLQISDRLAFDNQPASPQFSKVDNTVGLTLIGSIL